MDKIMAFIAKAKGSLTMWVMAALAVLTQIDPVVQWVGGLVGHISPHAAVTVTAVIAIITRSRSILTSVLADLKPSA